MLHRRVAPVMLRAECSARLLAPCHFALVTPHLCSWARRVAPVALRPESCAPNFALVASCAPNFDYCPRNLHQLKNPTWWNRGNRLIPTDSLRSRPSIQWPLSSKKRNGGKRPSSVPAMLHPSRRVRLLYPLCCACLVAPVTLHPSCYIRHVAFEMLRASCCGRTFAPVKPYPSRCTCHRGLMGETEGLGVG